jgi:hypothetical protein
VDAQYESGSSAVHWSVLNTLMLLLTGRRVFRRGSITEEGPFCNQRIGETCLVKTLTGVLRQCNTQARPGSRRKAAAPKRIVDRLIPVRLIASRPMIHSGTVNARK